MQTEEFRPIEGYGYSVTRSGVVRCDGRSSGYGPKSVHIMKTNLNRSGYEKVSLSRQGCRVKTAMIHRLVAAAFIPNPGGKRCVNHINGIKTDNHVTNLEWVSHSENMVHALKTGLRQNQDGANNCMAKLTEADVRSIRRIGSAIPQHKLGKIFGVAQSVISAVLRGRSWKSVAEEKAA